MSRTKISIKRNGAVNNSEVNEGDMFEEFVFAYVTVAFRAFQRDEQYYCKGIILYRFEELYERKTQNEWDPI